MPYQSIHMQQAAILVMMMAVAWSITTTAPSCVATALIPASRRYYSYPATSSASRILAKSQFAPSSSHRGGPNHNNNNNKSNNIDQKKPFRLFARPHKKDNLFRADRVVANRSGKPRKECFQLLQERRIFDSHGKSIDGPAAKIRNDIPLFIDGRHAVPLPPSLLAVYHKPKWVLSARKDPMNRPCIDSILPHMHPVGRLDYDTTGLLLFSSSGLLTQTLLHPKHAVEKEYCATVVHKVDEDLLRGSLADGVTTAEGVHTAKLLSVEPIPNGTEYLAQLRADIPESYNLTDLKLRGYLDIFDATELSVVRIVVQEGKYRMVRRILANVGHPVVSLHRVRIGNIRLNDLPVGSTRELSPDELEWAQSIQKRPEKGSVRIRKTNNDDDE